MADSMVDGNCPICKGSGLIAVAELADYAACESTGKILKSICVWCNGSGRQEINDQAFLPKVQSGRGLRARHPWYLAESREGVIVDEPAG